ncbi:glycoside hydrolase family 16 protein [Phytohabitans aurantiacus]|uniref:GH16 domain-containing protein n=1 Tax=Phytohabitans aurantiacus TaxID=3016789 RepID=A0ABQ5RB29_9ACTN|nr:glycoside hydrolase family 16 protein [Phytohabitans aurantiacus]GLI03367.1 hypothetical protein Pa4123_86450 [Phytohabitans aurantiacus]
MYNSPTKKPPRSPAALSVGGNELRIRGGFDGDGKDMSGGLQSSWAQLYGRWEARFRVDLGAGYSAVVLLWPETDQWPTDGEINLAEANRGNRQTALNYLHNGPSDLKSGKTMHADFTKWHTVAVEWLPDRVTFFLDGVEQRTVKAVHTPGKQNPVPSTSRMNLALQLDVGCDGFIQCRDADTPASVVMHVDWVKIYRASS